jgi:nickel-dependent lactate racemase
MSAKPQAAAGMGVGGFRALELPWGEGTLRVPIPPGWRVLAPLVPPLPAAADAETLCREALARPLGTDPLRDLYGKRVLLVSDDVSRPTPVHRFFGPIRDALEQAGARRDDIEILFALGVHRPMTDSEARAKVGPDHLAAHRWHNHDAFDPARLVRLGTTARGTPVALNRLLTAFDLIVTLGAIEPHLLLGFSGGLKMLLPGCAGAETIGHNHLQGTGDGRFNYVGARAEESPMRLDLEEGVDLLGKRVFAVNAVFGARGEIVRFFCGDGRAAFRAGADFARAHAEVRLPEPVDVVIANSCPFDADLRQGLKCVGNAIPAVRPGGVVLGFLRCVHGLGDVPVPSWTVPYPLLRPILHLIGRGNILRVMTWVRPQDPIEQRFLGHFGLQMLHRNHVWFYSDNLPPGLGRRLGMLRQFGHVSEMIEAAFEQVGPRATVAVFPQGGITFVACGLANPSPS